MARANFRLEQGIEILEPNGTGGVWILRGTGAPVGTTGATADAPVGSLWLREDSAGELYRKSVDTDSASDWERMVDESIYTAIGITFDDEDMGNYTGGVLTDGQSAKTNIQELSDAIEAISGGATSDDDIAAGTPTVVNSCLVDNCNGAEWEVYVFEQGDETQREYFKLTAMHDGTTSADAVNIDETTHTKLKFSGDKIAGLTFEAKLTGAGVAQTMGLEISATAAITVHTRRTEMPAV